MGLTSIWSAIVGLRIKEITPHRPFSFERQQEAGGVEAHANAFYTHHAAAFSEAAIRQPPPSPREDKSAKRRSRGFSLSKAKSEGSLKKRKSWFGGKPAAEDAPPVPALPVLRSTGSGLGRPDLLEPTHDARAATSGEAQEQALVSGLSSEGESEARLDRPATSADAETGKATISPRRPPRHVSRHNHRPILRHHPHQPSPGVVVPAAEHPLEKRKSQRKSLFSRERSKSSASHYQSSRNTWWASSTNTNPLSSDPDDSFAAPPIPAVPALIWDNDGTATPDSSIAFTASPDNSDTSVAIEHAVFAADSPVRTVTRGASIKHPRPVSGVSLSSRKSYVPRNAAKGFLRSTSGRSSRRHSLLDDGDGGMICLSDEQQREWEKLKHLMITLEGRQDQGGSPVYKSPDVVSLAEDNGVLGMLRQMEEEEDRRHRLMYSNAEALAALEFGTGR
ncbi:hypothetical protein LTR91_004254 [Friedmanniomyces endolithicus]|uniref:Uncharacterized protein n=1 Tax=Friedmanniomyces endolithicus TaxID=329885 RepID=A0AAN6QY24_9PEZI|nr:hypothetical protein LTR57_005359 [Friedmanniomyces endolithicus]KAK1004759.1 hypothetical protein LTR91_004254 [Friedmanniomyces endolithicus]KAK1038426.1 hypothetical protein LTS16_012085 [Friedmanniomyces endolithicus]